MLKKIGITFINLCMVFCLSACQHADMPEFSKTATPSETPASSPPESIDPVPTGKRITETWTSAGSSVCAWFSAEETMDSMGVNVDETTMHIGKTSDGKDIFSFLHLPMRGSLLGHEIETARLYLKIVEGKAPAVLSIGLVKDVWSNSITTLADAQKITDRNGAMPVAVRQEKDNWISIEITEYVVGWLNADVPNYGIVIFGENNGEQTLFSSDWDEQSQNPPRLEVTGMIENRNLDYGRFGYIRHPENEKDDARIAEDEVANCLSYALRDTNMITATDLMLDYNAMTNIYRESGEDAVADYCAEHVIDYVEQNKGGLKISGFRQIDDFDSEIDPNKEYRIALRVGCDLYDDEDVLDEAEGNFDYHLWAQINTGQWAQKFISDPTEIIGCTPPNVSPAKYPWDALLLFDGFYTSKIIYFAVTKDTDGFTEHKKAVN